MTIDFKQDILAPVAQDFAAMDTFINEGITSKVALVMAVSKHVVEAGGKRMRPIMCLLAAKPVVQKTWNASVNCCNH
jgi:octaprenyl-diphosphate synthase